MRTRPNTATALLLLSALAAACGERAQKARLPGDDKVVAEVNDTQITQYDVERTIAAMLGESAAERLDDAARKNVLQSLVQSRAIAQAREKELSVEQRAELEKKVAAYREELLVKQYLLAHTRQDGVSSDMVRQYYDEHPERFGGGKVRSYELVTVSGALAPAQRTKVIEALGQGERETDWRAWTERLKQAGHPVALRSGQGDEAVLHPKLRQLMDQLAVGKASKLTFIEGAPYAVRVTAERARPARPLAEVSDQIRKTLAPVKLKQAVKQASDQVLENAEVAYR
jgi:hypothetical protein